MTDRHIIEFTRSLARPEPVKPEWGQCKCGWTTGWQMTRDACEVLATVHMENVERVLLSLHRRLPGIADQHAYYLEMASATNTPKTDRVLWEQLARELQPRVQGVVATDEALF